MSPGAATPALPPGPGRLGSLRLMNRMGRDILGVMTDVAAEHGDVAWLAVPPRGIVLAKGAEAARHVLVTAQDRYPKAQQFDLFTPVLGRGLVTSSGDVWRRSRRMVQPLFAKRHLGAYADHMAAAAGDALDAWERSWPDGHLVDLDEQILHVGLDTVGRALATHDFSADAHRFETAMVGSLREIGEISRQPGVFLGQDLEGLTIRRAARMTTPGRWRRYLEHADVARAIIEELVDERYADGHRGRDDLLRLLIDTVDDETGRPLSRRQVLDEVVTFISAGHETTAHGLAWMFFLLSQPENAWALRRLREEVDGALGGRRPTAEDVDRLPWLTACFQEAMRIYPPVWHIPRVAAEDDVLLGHRVPAGTRVMVSVWATHRDPGVYPDPERFDPVRWLDGAAAERPRLSFLPFGGGRRACVGQGFAMLNATILGAMIAQRYGFRPASDRPPRLQPTITLRPIGGIPMYADRRVTEPRVPVPRDEPADRTPPGPRDHDASRSTAR